MVDGQNSNRELGFTALSSILHLALAVGIFKMSPNLNSPENKPKIIEFEIESAIPAAAAPVAANIPEVAQSRPAQTVKATSLPKAVLKTKVATVAPVVSAPLIDESLPEVDYSLEIPDAASIDSSVDDVAAEVAEELAPDELPSDDLKQDIEQAKADLLASNESDDSSFKEAQDAIQEQNRLLQAAKPVPAVSNTNNGGGLSANAANNKLDSQGASVSGMRDIKDLRQRPGNKAPAYDAQDRFQRKSGEIILAAYVTKSGDLSTFRMIKSTGHRSLDLKTLKALKTWKFYPGQEGWVEIPFVWDIKGGVKEMPTTLRRQISQK